MKTGIWVSFLDNYQFNWALNWWQVILFIVLHVFSDIKVFLLSCPGGSELEIWWSIEQYASLKASATTAVLQRHTPAGSCLFCSRGKKSRTVMMNYQCRCTSIFPENCFQTESYPSLKILGEITKCWWITNSGKLKIKWANTKKINRQFGPNETNSLTLVSR